VPILTREFSMLILPAIIGIADRSDYLVVVALGRKRATLHEDFKIPDWMPFDDLLGYSDVFVTNGGYGSF